MATDGPSGSAVGGGRRCSARGGRSPNDHRFAYQGGKGLRSQRLRRGAPGLRGRTKGNLNATLKNNNASHELLGAAPPTGYRTDRTNTKAPTTILAVVGAGVDILRRRPHLVDPDDAQRQHPEGPLLLDDDRLRCLGGRKLDVSQYGSHDLTAAGQDYQTILRHYYRDIALS